MGEGVAVGLSRKGDVHAVRTGGRKGDGHVGRTGGLKPPMLPIRRSPFRVRLETADAADQEIAVPSAVSR